MRIRLALVAALVAAGAGEARAWDSICHEYADPTKPVASLGPPVARGCDGMLAARSRWRDPVHWLDEHRAILRQAMIAGGLPMALGDTLVLSVPTLGNQVDVGGGRMMPQLWPLPLDYTMAIARLERRGFALDELAQLPDFSYSLADWAGGNERCPVPDVAGLGAVFGSAAACHAFKTHMGALNSSHFPPQSDRWYQWMHELARSRADQCKAMRAAAWTMLGAADAPAFDGRWTPVWRDCEIEALAIEAVAQHYLQDSWSSGHMWQRWGATNLGAFPAPMSTGTDAAALAWNGFGDDARRLMVGELVGLFSGTIHGSDPALFESALETWYLPRITADPVCYPRDATIAYGGAGGPTPAAGDMHLHDTLGDPLAMQLFGQTAEAIHAHYDSPVTNDDHTPSAALAGQAARLLGCATASVREIYDHLGDPMTFGPPTFGAATGAAPAAGDCAAPRLTARALAAGIESGFVAGQAYSAAVSHGAVLTAPPADIEGQAFFSYDETRRVGQLLARYQPDSTALADLAWPGFDYDEDTCALLGPEGDCLSWTTAHRTEPAGELRFFGVARNSAGAAAPGTRPAAFADPPLPWGDPAMPAALVDDSPEQVLASTFHRGHAPLWCARTSAAELQALEDRAKNAPAASKADLCRLCTEVVARHVRPAADEKALCEVLAPGAAVVTGDGEPARVAEARCGCADTFATIADSGLRFVRVDNAGGLAEVGGPYPAGTLARDAVAATRNRIFLTNGQGDVVGFRWAGLTNPGAVEMDLTPTDAATTRLHLGGDPRGIAFVESLGKDWLLVVDGATDLLRVYDLGDENVERFDLCSTLDVGRDPGRIEGAWDLVVEADGSRGFVSFRGPLNTPGDALAMFDLLPLFTCDGQNPPVTHVTTFGGGQGLGPMSLSPDGELLAVGARLRTTCLDRIYTNTAGNQVDAQVGCDLVYVLRVDQLAPGPLAAGAIVPFGARNSFPTRPLSYPYAVAWRPDGSEVAYGSFLGLSPWPLYSDMGAQGGLALGTVAAPAFPSPQGQLHWSYNAPLGGSVAGETVEFTADGRFVIAAAMDGKVYSFPASPTHDFWQNRESDPETIIHAGLLLRSWYGGCRVAGTCPGGWCPRNCPTGAADVPTLTLGSPIRKLLRL